MKEKDKNEIIFLEELVTRYKFWKAKGEEEYAQAYRVLLNQFSIVEAKNEE